VTVATSDEPNAVVTVVDWLFPLVAAIEAAAPAVFASEKLAVEEAPGTDAVTVYDPAVEVAVALTDATPVASVVAVVALSVAEAEPGGAENVTVAPDTGLPRASVTSADSDEPKAVPTVADCDAPPAAEMDATGPAAFVSENAVDAATPTAVPVTAYAPATLSAEAVVVARPLLSVRTVVVAMTAEAPLDGGANVTDTPDTPLPFESWTRATSGDANDVPTVAVCGLPLDTMMVAAGPGVFVSANEAEVPTPLTSAPTT
jgi:hypothetical protein